MGTPDMRLPIEYAITYPQRDQMSCDRLSLADVGTLTFARPDREAFPCLDICVDAIRQGGLKPAAANGANEEAVALFLSGKIKFLQIPELVGYAADAQKATKNFSLEDVFAADKAARQLVLKSV